MVLEVAYGAMVAAGPGSRSWSGMTALGAGHRQHM
jgi:hypothetical protein